MWDKLIGILGGNLFTGVTDLVKAFKLPPEQQIQFEQSLYQGLPVSTTTASTATSPFQQLKDILSGAGGVYDKVDTMTGGK